MNRKINSIIATASLGMTAVLGLNFTLANSANAADPLGINTAYPAEAATVLMAGEVTSWNGELLVNRTAASTPAGGYTAFNPVTGAASASGIGAAVGIVKTSVVFAPGSRLISIDAVGNINSVSPGGAVLLLGNIGGADSVVVVGNDLWISAGNSVMRFTPTVNLAGGLGLGIVLPPAVPPFAGGSTVKMTVGPDNKVWIAEKNPAGTDSVSRWDPTTGLQVGGSLPLSSLTTGDPTAIAAGSDNAVWVLENGTSKVTRFDATTLASSNLVLSGGPGTSIVNTLGGMWITENAANIVSRLSYSGSSFTRDAYPAPSAFGLQGLAVGPDNNIWAVGTNVNKILKVGTAVPSPTTTTTTIAPTTTAAPPSTVVATTLPATTVTATTAPATTVTATTAPATTAPTTAVAPTTVPATTAPPTTASASPTVGSAPINVNVVVTSSGKLCLKTALRRVRVGKKVVKRLVCIKTR